MVHPQRTSDEKRPGRGRQRINPREFATTGPRTPETAAKYLLHHGLRQDGGGDQGMVQILGFSGSSTDRPHASTVEVLSVVGPMAGSGTLVAVKAQYV
jgi:hypothetical protein